MTGAQEGAGAARGAEDVLRFWFEETPQERWFEKDAAFDAALRARFGALHAHAAAGGCADWEASAEGALALLIVLDQFSRNLYRDDPRAFACDERGRAVAERAIERGFDLAVPQQRRIFFYLPFTHSEDPADQDRCCAFVRDRVGDAVYLDYAERHRDVIRRFGRFPHRNAALERRSTSDEEEYLRQPGAGF
jgi:uncharacterized protein (DUF924 family)